MLALKNYIYTKQVLAVAAAIIGSHKPITNETTEPLVRPIDATDKGNTPPATPEAGRDMSYIDVTGPTDDAGTSGGWQTTSHYENPNFTTDGSFTTSNPEAPMDGNGEPTDSAEAPMDGTDEPNDSAMSPGASPEPTDADLDETQVRVMAF